MKAARYHGSHCEWLDGGAYLAAFLDERCGGWIGEQLRRHSKLAQLLSNPRNRIAVEELLLPRNHQLTRANTSESSISFRGKNPIRERFNDVRSIVSAR